MSKSTKFKLNPPSTRDSERKSGPRREAQIKQEISPVGDIPLLELSGRNYPLWEEKLYNYSVRSFGDIARTIKTRAAYAPPQVVPPEGMPEIAGSANEREIAIHHPLRISYNQEIQERVKLVKKIEELKPRLYGVIWDTLSMESQQRVKEMENFETEVADVFNLARLLTRIRTTHHTGATGIVAVDKKFARDQYGKIRQQRDESISDYHKRFLRSAQAIGDAGGTAPSDSDQAADFLASLDRSRYATLELQLRNAHMLDPTNQPYPASLTRAYTLASKFYVLSNSTSEIIPATTFVTTHKKGGGGGGGEKKKGKDKPDSKADKTKPVEKEKTSKGKATPRRPCSLCSEMHWTNECPFLDRCKELVDREDKKETAHVTHSRSISYPDSIKLDPRLIEEEDMENETAFVNSSALAISTDLPSTCVQLDTQASEHLFRNKDLLTNHRELKRPILFKGVEKYGKGLHVTMCGDFNEWESVPYHADSAANLLSVSKSKDKKVLEDLYHDLRNDTLVAKTKNDTYYFERMGGHYAFDTAAQQEEMIAVQTVDEN